VVLLTESDAAFNRRRRFIPEDKTVVIANGIPDPAADASLSASRRDVLQELGLPEDGWYIGNSCRLSAVKNLPLWLRAIAQLDEVGGRTVHGLVAGDGEVREDLEELAELLGISDRVHFAGFRRDRLALMKACDVFLTTSRSEGMSISVLEAMGLGMGIVATDVRGNRDCIRDRQDGLLVPFDEVDLTAAACRELLEDPQLRTALEKSARQRFEAEYGVETMKTNAWNKAYAPVLAGRGITLDSQP
jgi:glycosyltransferase involved in cell wall biosynthesis